MGHIRILFGIFVCFGCFDEVKVFADSFGSIFVFL